MEFVGLIRVTDLVVMEECGSNEWENKNDGRVRISEGIPPECQDFESSDALGSLVPTLYSAYSIEG